MIKHRFIALSLASIVFFTGIGLSALPVNAAKADFDIVIRRGKIIDGTGNPWFYGDVGIRGGKIVEIGDLSRRPASEEIDAKGLMVAPGFIDVHTHVDRGIFGLPFAANFIRDGVTTIVTGNCGSSVKDVGRYLQRLEDTGGALNIATLVGHNTALRAVKGDAGTALTPEQWAQCKTFLRKAMSGGAVGMSTGLEYSPGKFSSTEEIIELQKVVAELGGIYTSHMRNEDVTILPAIEEALRIGREAGCRVEISHFKIGDGCLEDGIEQPLAMVLEARRQGLEVWVDVYPYTASSTGISLLLPNWVFEQGSEKAREILSDPQRLKKVFADMKAYHEGQRHRTSFGYAVIASSRAYPQFAGKSIQEAAQILKAGRLDEASSLDPATLPEVSMEDQYRTIVDIHLKGGASCVYHSMKESDVTKILQSPIASVCNDSGVRKPGRSRPHPRGYGSRARVLGRYVRQQGALSVEQAVHKMTFLPATAFRFKDRGILREGAWADITIFDPGRVIDRATFADPHQYSEGINFVLVNGEIVLEEGRFTGRLPGNPIYGPAWQER